MPLPWPVSATFAAVVAAMALLWAPRLAANPRAGEWWILPFAASLVLAQGAGLVSTVGLAAVFAFVTACRLGEHVPDGALRGFALAVVLAMSAAFLAHVVPGFENPRVLDQVRLGADSLPYTKYLNLDKAWMGLLLLGLVAPQRTSRRSQAPAWRLGVRMLVVTVAVIALTVAAGFARWDPKLPAWWPLWLWSMAFLTALPEEALFRHLVQGGLQPWLGGGERGRWIAMIASGTLFGLAHLGGGWTYVGLATAAGIGYAWIYAVSGSIAASIVAHTALNLAHLLFFTYPALAP